MGGREWYRTRLTKGGIMPPKKYKKKKAVKKKVAKKKIAEPTIFLSYDTSSGYFNAWETAEDAMLGANDSDYSIGHIDEVCFIVNDYIPKEIPKDAVIAVSDATFVV